MFVSKVIRRHLGTLCPAAGQPLDVTSASISELLNSCSHECTGTENSAAYIALSGIGRQIGYSYILIPDHRICSG